jgi:hypothetical protein
MATLRPDHNPADKDKRAIAAKAKRMIRQAVLACGKGHLQYAVWRLEDRRGLVPTMYAFCYRDSGTGWIPASTEEAFGEIAIERDPENYFEHNGERVHLFRYRSGFNALTDYNPVSENVLKPKRDARRQRLIEEQKQRERDRFSLFADQLEDAT